LKKNIFPTWKMFANEQGIKLDVFEPPPWPAKSASTIPEQLHEN